MASESFFILRKGEAKLSEVSAMEAKERERETRRRRKAKRKGNELVIVYIYVYLGKIERSQNLRKSFSHSGYSSEAC